ncbi:MAG: delta-60 repeat domain-containing protein [Acidobacteriaceae bacterium]|nr:delta-60 repeat domain-containing protein [Acidobacteriaceae bacterium]
MYGFVVLKSPDGKIIAVGDEINTVDGNRIRSRLTFHFRDGSIDDEVSEFTQGTVFQLLTDHHIQKGPSFREPIDISIDVPSGMVSWRERKNGKDERHREHMDLPADLANGMTSLIVENFPTGAAELKVSYLAGGSKPRVVKLSATPDGEDTFRVGGAIRDSKKYKIHVEIGGVMGIVAPLIGKQPPDIEMWVTAREVPTFLKMRGPLYENGPIWSTEIAAPVW